MSKRKRIAIIIISVFIITNLCLSLIGHADVLSDLDDVYNNLSTYYAPPTYFKGPSRQGFSLGSFKVFLPNSRITPISITPPSIRATCGGISAYFGGFSFIDADKFVQLLQNIMNAAAGYFFEMAVEQLCPTCHNIMSILRHASQLAQKFSLDSCGLGRVLGLKAANALSNYTTIIGKIQNNGQGWFKNYDELVASLVNGDKSDIKKKIDNDKLNCDPKTGKNCLTGNIVYEWVKMAGGTKEDAEVIMSLIGTYIYTDSSNSTGIAPNYKRPILTAKMLATGCNNATKDELKASCLDHHCSGDKIPIYQCSDDNKCLSLTIEPVSKTNLKGKIAESLKNVIDNLNKREQISQNATVASDSVGEMGVFYYTPGVKEMWDAVKYYPPEWRKQMLDEVIDTGSEAFVYLYLDGYLRSVKSHYLKMQLLKIGPVDRRQEIRAQLMKNLDDRFKELKTLKEHSFEMVNKKIASLKNLVQLAEILHKKNQRLQEIVAKNKKNKE